MVKYALGCVGLAMALALGAPEATAQDLPRTNLKVLGMFSNLNAGRSVERPFWTEHLTKASGGRVTADYTTFDQMGLKGSELLRLIKLGVLDFGSGNLSMFSSDFADFDGLDLSGVILDFETMRKASDAYAPVLDKIMQEKYGAKLLMMWPNPPSILFCRDQVASLDDLKGKKVRSYATPLSDFIEGAGAVPVTVAFAEVVPALQRGTVDCGVTGSLSGNTTKWWEVTKYLYNLPVGVNPWFTAVSLATWNRLDAGVKALLTKEFVTLEADFWKNAAQQAEQGINCNTGKGECTLGVKGAMTLVEIGAADKAKLAQISKDVVVPRWAKRCGEACVASWNETVGKVVGFTVSAK